MLLPQSIKNRVDGKAYTCDNIGKSGSTVLCYEDMVLKAEPAQKCFYNDIAMLLDELF